MKYTTAIFRKRGKWAWSVNLMEEVLKYGQGCPTQKAAREQAAAAKERLKCTTPN